MDSANFLRCTLLLTTATVASACLGVAQVLAANIHNRPAAVPADYIVTPFGYFHSSCVMHAAPGDVIHNKEMSVEHANGAFDAIRPSQTAD